MKVLVLLLSIILSHNLSAEQTRFIDNNDGTITDTKTGLIWLKNANFAGGKIDGYSQENIIKKLNTSTKYNKWRIPNETDFFNLLNEMPPNKRISTLREYGFQNVQLSYYQFFAFNHYSIESNSKLEIPMSNTGYFWPVCDPEDKSIAEPDTNTLVAVADKPKTEEIIQQIPQPAEQTKPPVQTSSRFIDNNDGTITDTKTGLIWLKNANFAGGKVDINIDGNSLLEKLSKTTKYKKWRHSTNEDFFNLLKEMSPNNRISTLLQNGFQNVQQSYYTGLGTDFYSIESNSLSKLASAYGISGYLWPVCDPEEKSAIEPNTNTLTAAADKPKTEEVLPQTIIEPDKEKTTVQTDTTITDDNTIKSADIITAAAEKAKAEEIIPADTVIPKKKVLPRNKRFTAGKNNTVIDKKTGLMWIQDTSLCGEKTWKEAVRYSKSFSGCGYNDWRLPCRKDFEQLFRGRKSLSWAEFLETAGFSNIQEWYWTSTPSADFPKRDSYYANLNYGLVSTNKKSKKCYVWLVRGK